MNKYAVSLLFLSGLALYANPEGAAVVSGEAAISSSWGECNVTTKSHRSIIEWRSFSVEPGEATRFIQPSEKAAVLNRVNGSLPSHIHGDLFSNGKVYLVNPNGVVVGPEGRIDTAGFIATTFAINDRAFLQGEALRLSGDSRAEIVNRGIITTPHGDVALVAYKVDNQGKISAANVMIGAGTEVVLQPGAEGHLFIRTSGSTEDIQVQLQDGKSPYELAISNTGSIEAVGFAEKEGQIFLVADQGEVHTSGSIKAQRGDKGGDIGLLGKGVFVEGAALIEASGADGGGNIYIGGDYKGQNPDIQNAKIVRVLENARIYADATEQGNGGRVILWGTNWNELTGSIFARGGANSGDGGFIEVSSQGYLAPNGLINPSAANGKLGHIYFDPCAVTISTGADSGNTFSSNAYTFSGTTSNILISALVTHLQAGNVTIDATASGTAALSSSSITVTGLVQWNLPAAGNTLTLTSGGDITVSGGASAAGFYGVGSTDATLYGVINMTSTLGNIIIQGGTAANADSTIELDRGIINLSAAQDISLLGGSAASAWANARADNSYTLNGITSNSSLNVTVGRDLNLTGGSAQPSFAQLGSFSAIPDITAATGIECDINISSVGRNVNIQGGTAIQSHAIIGHGDFSGLVVTIGTVAAAINISNVGGDISLVAQQGGSQYAPALIGVITSSSLSTTVNEGSISIDKVNGNVKVIGGNAVGCFAMIGASTNMTVNCPVSITNVGGNVTVIGGTGGSSQPGFAIIGHGFGVDSQPSGFYEGNITLTGIGGNIVVQGGSGRSCAQIGFMGMGSVATFMRDSTLTLQTAGTLQVLGGTGDRCSAVVGWGSPNFAVNGSLLQNLVINVSTGGGTAAGNGVEVIGGISGTSNCAVIGYAFDRTTISGGFVQSVNVNSRSGILVQGGDNQRSYATIGYYSTAVVSTAQLMNGTGVVVQTTGPNQPITVTSAVGGTSQSGAATIGFGSEGVPGVVSSGSDIGSHTTVIATGTINVNQSATTSAPGRVQIGSTIASTRFAYDTYVSGNEILLNAATRATQPAAIAGNNNVTVLSNKSISLQGYSMMIANYNLTLVADNAYPVPPKFGDGIVSTLPTTPLQATNGLIRIYQGSRPLVQRMNGPLIQNSDGFYNSQIYIPGPPFVTSLIEEWGVYYPSTGSIDGPTGPTYAFYYKQSDVRQVALFNTAISEALRNLEAYDRKLYYPRMTIVHQSSESQKFYPQLPYQRDYKGLEYPWYGIRRPGDVQEKVGL